MNAKVKYLDMLLDAVCEKSGHGKHHAGLKECNSIIGLAEGYLYKHIYYKIRNKAPNDEVGVGSVPVSLILKYLEYPNFQAFIYNCDRPIDNILVKAVGSYYSYVRENSDEGFVLRSPAKIFMEDRQVHFELRGPKWIYSGKVHFVNGCLFITMNSHSGKSFHHVYKIGLRERPEMLLGVFTGVSTAFDPIGGRAVLERSDRDYKDLEAQRLSIEKLGKSKSKRDVALAKYFEERLKNNLIVPPPTTFTYEDLVKN
jgi:hypothetical protein